MKSKDEILWNVLKNHIGHNVEIVEYGDGQDICLECTDCNEVLLDAEIYTIVAREDEPGTKAYMINGYTKNIGSWCPEHFRNEEDAIKSFNNYVTEYDAKISEDDEWYATTNDGYGWFTITEIEV